MRLNLFGFGVDVYQTHVGGAPDVPEEYAWCIKIQLSDAVAGDRWGGHDGVAEGLVL